MAQHVSHPIGREGNQQTTFEGFLALPLMNQAKSHRGGSSMACQPSHVDNEDGTQDSTSYHASLWKREDAR